MVHATDTDVVVIAVSESSIFQSFEVCRAFGHGNKLRYITCHLTANELGTDASCCLLFFQAMSGCDTISAFPGVGKKTAWAIWRSLSHLDQIFAWLSHAPKHISPPPPPPPRRVNDARKHNLCLLKIEELTTFQKTESCDLVPGIF